MPRVSRFRILHHVDGTDITTSYSFITLEPPLHTSCIIMTSCVIRESGDSPTTYVSREETHNIRK